MSLLHLYPPLIGKVLVFSPSARLKLGFLCLKDSKVVDLRTSECFLSIDQWWSTLELTEFERNQCKTAPLGVIHINHSDSVTLADLQEEITKIGKENISVNELLSQLRHGQSTSGTATTQVVMTEADDTMQRHQIATNTLPELAAKSNVMRRQLRFRSTDMATEVELALYALLLCIFEDREHAYRAHNEQNLKLMKVVCAMNALFPDEPTISTASINNYFSHSRSRSRGINQLGRIQNTWRWSYFKCEVDQIVCGCEAQMKALLSIWVDEDMVHVRATVNDAKTSALQRIGKKLTTISPLEDETSSETKKSIICGQVLSQRKNWRMVTTNTGNVQLCLYKDDDGSHAIRKVDINAAGEWQMSICDKQYTFPWFECQTKINTEKDIKELLDNIEQAVQCQGCSQEKYQSLVDRRGKQFTGRDGSMIVDPKWYQSAIRSTSCSGLLPKLLTGKQQQVCPACMLLDNSLRKALSRQSHSSQSVSKHIALVNLTREELIQAAHSLIGKVRKQRADYHKLLDKQKCMQMLTVNDNSRLRYVRKAQVWC